MQWRRFAAAFSTLQREGVDNFIVQKVIDVATAVEELG